MARGGRKRDEGPAPEVTRPWPALAVEMRKLGELKLSERNPRSHTLEQIEQISKSMDAFGWTIPILIDEENGVLAGHGRVRAARLKGWSEAPVVIARGWTAEQKSAYMIADNKIASNSDWDRKRLQSEVRGLVAAEFDVTLLAFSDEDFGKLIIDPPKLEAAGAEPTEVVMKKCPTCGRLSRKLENERQGS